MPHDHTLHAALDAIRTAPGGNHLLPEGLIIYDHAAAYQQGEPSVFELGAVVQLYRKLEGLARPLAQHEEARKGLTAALEILEAKLETIAKHYGMETAELLDSVAHGRKSGLFRV